MIVRLCVVTVIMAIILEHIFFTDSISDFVELSELLLYLDSLDVTMMSISQNNDEFLIINIRKIVRMKVLSNVPDHSHRFYHSLRVDIS